MANAAAADGAPVTAVASAPELAQATAVADAPGAPPPAATLVDVPDDEFPGTELPAARFQGRWEVIDVAADAFAADDFKPEGRLVGRSFTFTPDAAVWSDREGAVEEMSRCASPLVGIVQPTRNARELARPFRTAWAKFQLPPADVGLPHNFVCDSEEEAQFQPGEGIMFPVGRDRLVMNWFNHNIILLHRTGS